MRFDQNTYNEFVLENDILQIRENPFTLKSGRESHIYANYRSVAQNAVLVDILTDHILRFTEDNQIEPTSFIGVPEGATSLGLITQFKHYQKRDDYTLPLPMGRGKSKEHGDPKNSHFIGFPVGETAVLEDVTTTGGSMIEFIEKLQGSGFEVSTAIGLTNRNEITQRI